MTDFKESFLGAVQKSKKYVDSFLLKKTKMKRLEKFEFLQALTQRLQMQIRQIFATIKDWEISVFRWIAY